MINKVPAIAKEGEQLLHESGFQKSLNTWLIKVEKYFNTYKIPFLDSHREFCVWLTGLPCSGKTTIANDLLIILKEKGKK